MIVLVEEEAAPISLSNLAGIPSGPVVWCSLMFIRSLATPAVLSIDGCGLVTIFGKADETS